MGVMMDRVRDAIAALEGKENEEKKESNMSNATKCQNCGKFEEGLGYSVRIYQRIESTDPKGNLREKVNKLVTRDYLCYECASEVANVLHETLIPD